MSFGEKLFNAMTLARIAEPYGKLSKEKWIELADRLFTKEKPASVKRKVNVLGKGLSDEQWFAELAGDPDYHGIDIAEEARRCRLYFKGKLIPSRARVVRWLSKATPMQSSNGSSARTPAGHTAIPVPDDWSGLIRDDEEDGRWSGSPWESIMPFYQRRIARKVEQMKRVERAQR